jgi:hypothetical protein
MPEGSNFFENDGVLKRQFTIEKKEDEFSLFNAVLPTLRSTLDESVALQHFSEVLAPSVLIPIIRITFKMTIE